MMRARRACSERLRRNGALAALSIALLLSAGTLRAGSADWAPPPAPEDRAEEARLLANSILVRGPRMEMGEVVALTAEAPGVVPEARVKRVGAPDDEALPLLSVGDRIRKGDEIRTPAGVAAEILLGLNARMRIDPASRVRMRELNVEETPGGTITYRRVELLAGGLRARVRQNAVTPTPVLVISVAATLSVGLPRLAEPGGVDIVVQVRPETTETEVRALNGGVRVSRDGRDRLDLMRGHGLAIDARSAGFRHPRPLGDSTVVASDIVDWTRLFTRLRAAGEGAVRMDTRRSSLREIVWRRLPAPVRDGVVRLLDAGPAELLDLREEREALRGRFLDALNSLLRETDLFTGVNATLANFSEEERSLLSALRDEPLEPEEVALFNRTLLESALSGEMQALAENRERTEAAIAAVRRRHAFSTESRGAEPNVPPPPRDSTLGGP